MNLILTFILNNPFIILAIIGLLLILSWLNDLRNSRSVLVYDVETIRSGVEDHLDEVEGSAFDKIVFIGYYDYLTDRYGYCLFPNFKPFQKLVKQRRKIVGFNSLSFDDQVCKKNGIAVNTHFDVYERVKLAAKHQGKHGVLKGYSLDNLSRVNFGEGKIENANGKGVEALWLAGDIDALAKYCLQDVKLTRMLYDRRRSIKDPNGKKRLNLTNIIQKL